VIEVQNLTKYYGNHPALLDVTFSAKRGEILGFLGPNGAGKTTAMRILTCFLPPSSGGARIAGYDIFDDSIEVRKRIGYVPENVPLYGDLSVSKYLALVAKLKGMNGRKKGGRLDEVMEECGIFDVKNRTIGKLSKGYRQRVGIAQALINDPEVLILDEPTVGLDPRQIIEIRGLIQNLSGQRTIILSTHILPEASLLCQRIIIINKGKLITDDTPENLKYNLRRSMAFDVLISGDEQEAVRALESIPEIKSITKTASPETGSTGFRLESRDNKDIRADIAQRLVNSGFGLLGLNTIDMSLEDIFVQLVTEEE